MTIKLERETHVPDLMTRIRILPSVAVVAQKDKVARFFDGDANLKISVKYMSESTDILKSIKIISKKIENTSGGITFSKDSKYDFVSRFFCADDGISEDPVTGSSHSTLAPYWAKIFDKNILKAYQASKRGGELWLEVRENRVMIEGEAVTVITGKINF